MSDLDKRLATLSPRKRKALLQRLQQNQAVDSGRQAIQPRQQEGNIFPLSFAQQRLWFLEQLEPGGTAYLVAKSLRIRGVLSVRGLELGLQELISRHESLRTIFAERAEQPVQIIQTTGYAPLPVIDLYGLRQEQREQEALRLAGQEAQHPCDLEQGPLLRVSLLRMEPEDHILLLTLHHIVTDGWSTQVLVRELTTLYQAAVLGRPSPLAPLPIQYADYALWQRQWLQGEVLEEHLSYWKQQLANAPALLELPTDHPRPRLQTFAGSLQGRLLSPERLQQVQRLGQQEGVTLFMTLLAAFQILLLRYSGQTDIVVGSPIANRTRAETEGLIGFFVNTLVLRSDLSGQPSFRDLLARVREVTLQAYAHQDLPFEQIVEAVQVERSLSHSPLFQVLFALQNTPDVSLDVAGLSWEAVEMELTTTKFDLSLYLQEGIHGLQMSIEYNTALFDASSIARLLDHWQILLASIVENPAQRITELPLLTQDERELLLVGWNQAASTPEQPLLPHERFEQQVERAPEAIALVYEGHHLTYQELDQRANQLARWLRTQGVVPEVLVGVFLERSVEMLVALLGVLKAGGAYVPLDPGYPQERLTWIVQQADPAVLLTQSSLARRGLDWSCRLFSLDSEWTTWTQESSERLVRVSLPEHLAYVIYTSGSTGRPKGVAISQQALSNFLSSMREQPGMGSQDRLLAVTTISFDIAGLELFLPLWVGGQVVLSSQSVSRDGQRLASLIQEEAITLMQATPTTWNLLLQEGWQGSPHLRVLCGGEALPPALAVQLEQRCAMLWNMYGPTETTIWSTCSQMREGSPIVSIGHPIAQTQTFLLDANQQLVPIGVAGELYLGGLGLSRGYLRQGDLTAERFVPHPWSQEPGARLYRTGDLARYRADGAIEYVGRLDHQVKLRGYRIELGEIEATLQDHPAIQDAVVLVREDQAGDTRLVGYVVLDPLHTEVTTPEVQASLMSERLKHWHQVYDELYQQTDSAALSIVGWNSSYTDQPIVAQEMQAWQEDTLTLVRAYQPERIWEIGCGTGLLLFLLAPLCSHYYGIDFSASVLESVRQRLASLQHEDGSQVAVTLQQRQADDFNDIPEAQIDTVLINSVVQYFPDVEYLRRVLDGALRLVAPGGRIIVGDVRSLPLLEAFHASVQLYRAPDTLTQQQLWQQVQQHLQQEQELVLDPAFFWAWAQASGHVQRVEVRLKRGRYTNELTQFRYQVVLHVGEPLHEVKGGMRQAQIEELDWSEDALTRERLYQKLLREQPQRLRLRHVPNARVEEAIQTVQWLKSESGPGTVEQWRVELGTQLQTGMEPEDLWELAEQLGYRVTMNWGQHSAKGSYTVLLQHKDSEHWVDEEELIMRTPQDRSARDWQHYANEPLHQEVEHHILPQLRTYLSAWLPEYMVPSSLMVLKTFPLTANGKLDRRALPAPGQSVLHDGVVIEPRTPLEELICNIWVDLLHLRQSHVDIHDNFFALGGHSLLATRVVSRLRQSLQMEIPLRVLFECPTIAALASQLEMLRQSETLLLAPALLPVARSQEVPLSFAQERLWFLNQLEPSSTAYHIPIAVRLRGQISVIALEKGLQQLIERHESLRTTFVSPQERPVQVIASVLSMPILIIDVEALAQDARDEQTRNLLQQLAQQPFDLARGPLLRLCLLRVEAQEHVLLVNMHHIVTDGWSTQVLVRELTTLYQAAVLGRPSPLAPLPIQYADYALWQREWLQGGVLEEHLSYWKRQLAGAPALLELPTDHPRPRLQTFAGSLQRRLLSPERLQQVQRLSQQEGVTLFMTLLAAFQVLLMRYSGQTDIVVGSPIANRTRAETEGLIGFFVNTLVLRSDLSGQPSFRDLLARVREVTLQAYAHQELSFEQLVEAVQVERSLSHTPLFQVLFALQNMPDVSLDVAGLSWEAVEMEQTTTKFDLSLYLQEGIYGLQMSIEYNTALFEVGSIARLLDHWQILLASIVENPAQRITELPFLKQDERELLLVGWNQAASTPEQPLLLHERFEQQVERAPEAIALVYEGEHLTYQELDQRANQLARWLRTQGVGPEVLVGVFLERSVEMLIALLGILKAGGAYVPLDPEYPQERLTWIVQQADPAVLLTQSSLARRGMDWSCRLFSLDSEWTTWTQESSERLVRVSLPEHLAYVIYTSGSTGRPKGVAISQQALSNFLSSMCEQPGMGSQDRLLAVTTISFDIAGLELFLPLWVGGQVVLSSQVVSRDGQRLACLMQEEAITLMQATPTTWTLLLQAGWQGSSHLRVLCGGEALPPALAMQLEQRCAVVWNMYGPTETTIWSTCSQVREGSPTVSIGRPIAQTQTFLLDANQQLVPIGVAGELYLGGLGLSRGYLRQGDLTAERFVPHPWSQEPGARLYRTGDLARYRADGAIDYLGRQDSQVKLRGFRIELGEIEEALRRHPALQEAAVVLREDARGETFLVAYVVALPGVQPSREVLREWLSQQVPNYMVPSNLLLLDALPLTPNGKLDRRALPAPEPRSPYDGAVMGPRTPLEEVIMLIWADLLHLSPSQVSIHDNFFALGGHSLLATQVISRIRQMVQIELPLRALFEAPTLAEFAQRIETQRYGQHHEAMMVIVPAEHAAKRVLSFAQERLWFLYQLEAHNSFYTMSSVLHPVGRLSVKALERSLATVVQRHEILRTTFVVQQDQPVQVIAPVWAEINYLLPVIDLSGLDSAEQEHQVHLLLQQEEHYQFDLVVGPLLRWRLLRLNAQDHVLVFMMHHIISDGWSMGVLTRELLVLYQASLNNEPSPLPPLAIQYADYAHWQRQWLQGEVLQVQLDYWQKQLKDAPELLNLPTDRPRPALQSYVGSRVVLVLPPHLCQALVELSQREGVTLYMTLLAAYQVLLMRYSGQSDILVGTPIANRTHEEVENLIGFFVNTLVMRTDLSGNPGFRQVLARVREVALGAFAHQDLPFEKLVDALQVERSPGYSPLFQVFFAFQNTPQTDIHLSELAFLPATFEHTTAKFDLAFDLHLTDQGLRTSVEYVSALFDASTIQRLLGHWQVLLEAIVSDADQHVEQLPLLTQPEWELLHGRWDATAGIQRPDVCLHQLFEQQVEYVPDAVALSYEEQSLTYRELNQRANQLAHHLRMLGVAPEIPVGICMERSLEMVIGILAILKAGGVFVPLDPTYPQARLTFMLQDAQPVVVLTQINLRDLLSSQTAQVLFLDSWSHLDLELTENPISGVSTENLAYLIYTSGSTGEPKSTMNTHQGICNNMLWKQEQCAFTQGDSILQRAPLSFDASIEELFLPLMSGGRLVVARPEGHKDSGYLVDLLAEQAVTALSSVPSLLQVLLEERNIMHCQHLRVVLCGGEAMPPELPELFFSRVPAATLYNLYGPTEAAIQVTSWTCRREDAPAVRVPIGFPIANTQIYLLDAHLQPVPLGVAGEVYLGGMNLGRGYFNRPAVTAARFLPHPLAQTPGERLYRTGDLARYRVDGAIEYLGRVDQQVKVRGVRIELGEIEAALQQHPAVQESVALVREDMPGDQRLVAYVVPAFEKPEVVEVTSSWAQEHVGHWQALYEETYRSSNVQEDPTFNIFGWNSSYTGLPIPVEEMREQIEQAVERILERGPQRVMEIGCGTGLLLFRVAPHCREYVASDFSQEALTYVQQVLTTHPCPQVTLAYQQAHEALQVPPESFDAIILNSVLQYFPDSLYVVRVLTDALAALKPGGFLFLGDLRNLVLQKAYVTSVEWYRAQASLTREELRRTIQQRMGEEEELLLDPAFFSVLQRELPQIGQVQVLLKRGHASNELTRFRYDVVVRKMATEEVEQERIVWDWRQGDVTPGRIESYLRTNTSQLLQVEHVPNTRLAKVQQQVAWVFGEQGPEMVKEQREELEYQIVHEPDPEVFWAVGERSGYRVTVRWSAEDDGGSYDLLFSRPRAIQVRREERQALKRDVGSTQRWLKYANNPLQGKMTRTLIPQLRSFLKTQLVEYALPSHYVILESLPLTPNGKVDRRALPLPDRGVSGSRETFVAPQTQLQERLATIWTELLHISQISIHDNFFELGGHSLLATQLMMHIRTTFQVDVPLRSLFEAPTIVQIAMRIEQLQSELVEQAENTDLEQMLSALEGLSDDALQSMLSEQV